MRRIGSQDYAVVQQDFPIKIEIEAFDLAVYQCVPSRVVVTRPDGTPVSAYDLQLEPVYWRLALPRHSGNLLAGIQPHENLVVMRAWIPARTMPE